MLSRSPRCISYKNNAHCCRGVIYSALFFVLIIESEITERISKFSERNEREKEREREREGIKKKSRRKGVPSRAGGRFHQAYAHATFQRFPQRPELFLAAIIIHFFFEVLEFFLLSLSLSFVFFCACFFVICCCCCWKKIRERRRF